MTCNRIAKCANFCCGFIVTLHASKKENIIHHNKNGHRIFMPMDLGLIVPLEIDRSLFSVNKLITLHVRQTFE